MVWEWRGGHTGHMNEIDEPIAERLQWLLACRWPATAGQPRTNNAIAQAITTETGKKPSGTGSGSPEPAVRQSDRPHDDGDHPVPRRPSLRPVLRRPDSQVTDQIAEQDLVADPMVGGEAMQMLAVLPEHDREAVSEHIRSLYQLAARVRAPRVTARYFEHPAA